MSSWCVGRRVGRLVALLGVVAVSVGTLGLALPAAASASGGLTFSNTLLDRPEGASEPTIAFGPDGSVAITALSSLFDQPLSSPSNGTRLWTAAPGQAPVFRGAMDGGITKPGSFVFGGLDADADIGSTGTLHGVSLVAITGGNEPLRNYQEGIAATTCPGAVSPDFALGGCTRQILDSAGSDRPFITSDGPHVWITYLDAGRSALVHLLRSDDDGQTWTSLPSPIVGQGGATGESMANSGPAPITVDTSGHTLYAVWGAGDTAKGTITAPNNIFVSRSTDSGAHWQASLVYSAPAGTSLLNMNPTIGADPITGKVYAAWSDGTTVSVAASSDGGRTWSAPVAVSSAPAATAIYPWLSAYGGIADVVYYGTTASSRLDPGAVWNVYLAQSTDGGASFAQSVAGNTPNHVGAICNVNYDCAPGKRNLLDLFGVAIDPLTGLARIAYADDTKRTIPSSRQNPIRPTCLQGETVCPLPEVVLADQMP